MARIAESLGAWPSRAQATRKKQRTRNKDDNTCLFFRVLERAIRLCASFAILFPSTRCLVLVPFPWPPLSSPSLTLLILIFRDAIVRITAFLLIVLIVLSVSIIAFVPLVSFIVLVLRNCSSRNNLRSELISGQLECGHLLKVAKTQSLKVRRAKAVSGTCVTNYLGAS
jgi:hypothetical protein